ncbi:hypothetical protein MPS01_13950 [Marinilactibacillus psychrotolerans]|uniref:Uncharacterized protein n=1 Tax=Marinilactibacillus psychrotolerans TaxID=191770 RepID=A0AAV3WYT5_9LACT|nr:hypothetical protein MPS01_13950 [Marinilactibacillus psychrotolerans]GEQ36044.1 hypothetical protein M132T_15520 [Marinilactibacillus psychrotolerans]SDC61182.1 hypothetical protein SAMN04488013_10756 [Marinilactibacillus psychrotolerans]
MVVVYILYEFILTTEDMSLQDSRRLVKVFRKYEDAKRYANESFERFEIECPSVY